MAPMTFKIDDAKISVYLDGPVWDGQVTATVGGFAFKTLENGKNVLQQAIAYVSAQGVRQIIGPMDGDTWHSYRFVTHTDGSPAFLLEPKHSPDAVTLFEAAGFAPISEYFSAKIAVADTAHAHPPTTTGFRIEKWDGTNPTELFEQVFDLSTRAFSENPFYKPISKDDFLAMYLPMVSMLKPELILFARRPDGTLAGFLFGTPNYAEGPQPKSVILKTYASLERGAGQHLAYAFHKSAATLGYETAIHALIHDDNQSAERSAAEGADVFRRYALFGLKLDG